MYWKVRPPTDETSQESLIRFLLVGGAGFFLFPVFAWVLSPLIGDWVFLGLLVYIFVWAILAHPVMSGKIKLPAMTWAEEQRRKAAELGSERYRLEDGKKSEPID